MTSATTGLPGPPRQPDQEARPTGNRRKVYVDGPVASRSRSSRSAVRLAGPQRRQPNQPVRLYDTSGRDRCDRGLPPLRGRGSPAAATGGLRGRPVNRRDDVGPPSGGAPTATGPFRPAERATALDRCSGDPAALRPTGESPRNGLRGRARGSGPEVVRTRSPPAGPSCRNINHPSPSHGHRLQLPGQGQRQHRQLRGDLVHRRGGGEADLGHRWGPTR